LTLRVVATGSFSAILQHLKSVVFVLETDGQ